MTRPPTKKNPENNPASRSFREFSTNPWAKYPLWYRSLKWLRYHVRITIFLLVIFILACIFITAEFAAASDIRPSSILG